MMDDFMPVMDGPTTLTNLKQIEGFNIPVIALTANSESDSKSKYVGLGFNNYLAKPIVKEELNKELKEFLV
jgi:CheY-like chemotaxis protein